eukprot:SAG31_NODE_16471_length_708_cov_0.719212_1_plen_88_part_10
MPRFIRQLQLGQPLTVHGSGSIRRCFVHVTDVARAVVAVLHRGTDGEAYNIGTRNELSIRQLAQRLLDHHAEHRALWCEARAAEASAA